MMNLYRKTFEGLFFLTTLLAFASGGGRIVEVLPGDGNSIVYEKHIAHRRDTIKIRSDIPVSILQYSSSGGEIHDQPIRGGEAYVYVKTNCPEQFNVEKNTVNVTLKYDGSDRFTGIDVSNVVVNINDTSKYNESANEFLGDGGSSFKAKWDHFIPFCRKPPQFATVGPPAGEPKEVKEVASSKNNVTNIEDFIVDGCTEYQHSELLHKRLNLTMHYVVNTLKSKTSNESYDVLTVQIEYPQKAWLGFAVSSTGGMIGSEAVIGQPDKPPSSVNPGKYKLKEYDLELIEPMSEDQQTLINATIEQTNSSTLLTFTKLLREVDELEIDATKTFLWAVGYGNELEVHKAVGEVVLDLQPCANPASDALSVEITEIMNSTEGNKSHVEKDVSNMPNWDDAGTSIAKTCYVNLEILQDECEGAMDVVAPNVRILDFQLSNQSYIEQGGTCMVKREQVLNFPQRKTLITRRLRRPPEPVATSVSSPPQIVNIAIEDIPPPQIEAVLHIPTRQCYRFAIGRPFLDTNGTQLQADVHKSENACWATSSEDNDADASETSNDKKERSNEGAPIDMGLDWTRRGLAEHASIASFAAFTLALMSNDAPPDLVRDSLSAAVDELEHAKTSFEIVKLLTGEVVEPGSLPPSSHDFGNDMTTLALGTAREGCIDETLSALAAAAEADSYRDTSDVVEGQVTEGMLKQKLNKIALDEGRHSALAWRTVRWVCLSDKTACEVVKKEVLNSSYLSNAIKKRFPSGVLDTEWENLWTTLVPYVTMENNGACSGPTCAESDAKESTIEKLVDNIIRGAFGEKLLDDAL